VIYSKLHYGTLSIVDRVRLVLGFCVIYKYIVIFLWARTSPSFAVRPLCLRHKRAAALCGLWCHISVICVYLCFVCVYSMILLILTAALWPRVTLIYRSTTEQLTSQSPADHTKRTLFTSMHGIWHVRSGELTMLLMLMVKHEFRCRFC